MIMKGEIYYADLEPVIGSEQGGIRPVLVVSNDRGNKYSPTVIVAPITSKVLTRSYLPIHVPIKAFEKIKRDSVILIEQVRVIDKSRLKSYLGKIDCNLITGVDRALIVEFGINDRRKINEQI